MKQIKLSILLLLISIMAILIPIFALLKDSSNPVEEAVIIYSDFVLYNCIDKELKKNNTDVTTELMKFQDNIDEAFTDKNEAKRIKEKIQDSMEETKLFDRVFKYSKIYLLTIVMLMIISIFLFIYSILK